MQGRRRTEKEKDALREKLIRAIVDAGDNWPTRDKYAEIIGYQHKRNLYDVFDQKELQEIDAEAFQRKRFGRLKEFDAVERKVLAEAKEGDMTAAQIVYKTYDKIVTGEADSGPQTVLQIITGITRDGEEE